MLKIKQILNSVYGNSLTVQWLGLGTFTAEGPSSIPGQGTKNLRAMQCGQKKPQNSY